MEQLQKLFADLLASQRFAEEELDYGIVKRHVENLSTSSLFTGSAISIFDLCHRSHVYESEYHKALFSDPDGVYEGMRIHPDDYATVMKHGVAGMKHVFMRKDNLNVSGRLTLQGGDRYSPIDVAASEQQQEAVYDQSRPYSEQLSPAFIAHMTVSYRINRRRQSRTALRGAAAAAPPARRTGERR